MLDCKVWANIMWKPDINCSYTDNVKLEDWTRKTGIDSRVHHPMLKTKLLPKYKFIFKSCYWEPIIFAFQIHPSTDASLISSLYTNWWHITCVGQPSFWSLRLLVNFFVTLSFAPSSFILDNDANSHLSMRYFVWTASYSTDDVTSVHCLSFMINELARWSFFFFIFSDSCMAWYKIKSLFVDLWQMRGSNYCCLRQPSRSFFSLFTKSLKLHLFLSSLVTFPSL